MKELWDIYTPPFKHCDSGCGYVFDSKDNMVADHLPVDGPRTLRVRGWGRMSYMPPRAGPA